jgi:hypothetical protein
LCFNLWLFLSLTDTTSSSGKFHISYTNLGHVQSFTFDTHNCHLLPNCRILNIFNTLISLIEISRGKMKAEVQNRILNSFIIIIYFLEIMQSSLLDNIILFDSLDWVEMGYFKSKDVDTCRFEHKFILVFDTCFISIEESQKLAIWLLLLFLFILLLSIFLTFFICFSLLSLRNLRFWSLNLHSKISHFFFIPINSNRNIIFAKIIAYKAIGVNIIDMETMIDRWTIICNTIRNDSYLLTISIDWTTFYISY